jgi:hypothetical protein
MCPSLADSGLSALKRRKQQAEVHDLRFNTNIEAQPNVKRNLRGCIGHDLVVDCVLDVRFSHCVNAPVNRPHHRTLKPNRRQGSDCRATHSDSGWNVRHSDSQTRRDRVAADANGLPS